MDRRACRGPAGQHPRQGAPLCRRWKGGFRAQALGIIRGGRTIKIHALGELRDRSFDNQAFRASGLNLLVAAITLWNTRYLQAAFDALAARGAAVPLDVMRHIAPLGWEHISLTGDYVWAADAQPEPGLLRPLRERPSLLDA